jgi:hypothetical protein
MIEGKKLWKELLSVEDQPTKPVITQTCTGVFSIRAVSDTISVTLFFSEPACEPRGQLPRTTV